MKTELLYLACAAAFTGLLWIPYVLDRMGKWGLADTVGYPAVTKPQSPWAERLRRAHANAVENLVVFAALVGVAVAAGISSPVIAQAAVVYFWARVVHALAYAFAVPWLRTLAFAFGFLAQAAVAWQIFVH
jgi:uncharacterized MAPEG superfamily protein